MKDASKQPRILFLDDNIRDLGGHYLELASLLGDGAGELGYRPELVVHQSLLSRNPDWQQDSRLRSMELHPRFDVRRMENWSLGVDGPSRVGRDTVGRPATGSFLERIRQGVADRMVRPSRRPGEMVRRWADGLVEAVEAFSPSAGDRIVVNTGNDFQMVALALAVQELSRRHPQWRLNLHVLFHFAVFDGQVEERAIRFGDQVNRMIDAMEGHSVRIHGTTKPLVSQLQAVGIASTAVPYPTRRPSGRATGSGGQASGTAALKVVLGGMPRAEKGRDQIRELLGRIEHTHLRSGKLLWSMQLPRRRWQRMVPTTMHDLYAPERAGELESGLEALGGDLKSEDYHRWLSSAGVGLFLYDPKRYVTRCSGVLLEMMIRGIPVIVPAGCWLADQVNEAGRSIGLVYHSVDQIPQLLDQMAADLQLFRVQCAEHANHVIRTHSGSNTLAKMGIPDLSGGSIRKAG